MTKKHPQTNNGDIANNKLWFSNQKYVTIKQQQERNMTRFLLLSLLALMYTNTGMSASWWEQPTVCRMDTTRCYTSMGAGFDSEIWDTDKKCWGMKMLSQQKYTHIYPHKSWLMKCIKDTRYH